MFRGAELPRLMSMLVMLAVITMLFVNMRNPAMWAWVAHGRGNTAVATHAATDPPTTSAAHVPHAPAGKQPVAPPSTPLDSQPKKPETAPPDEDWDQQAEVAQEFQAVLDGSLDIQPEENFAYARLLSWVQQQSWDDLCRRARSDVMMSDLMHSPAKYRGRLVKLDLNVRRVLACDVDNRLIDARRLYEIWGFTEDSKSWLFDVVTAELPEGMPIGPDVSERAQFVGYFFKLQGYYEAGAKPRAAPLRAPLLVGRLVRYPSATELQATGPGWWELGAAAVVGVLILALFLTQQAFFRRAAERRTMADQQTGQRTHEWLQQEFHAADETTDHEPTAEVQEISRSRPS